MRWYSTESQMYQLYVVFLVVLAILPIVADGSLLRCYSCTWSREDTARMFECMNGSDLVVTYSSQSEAPNSQYISQAQCAQCTKQELYKGGKLVSMVRSCTMHHDMLDTDLLPVPGCTRHELRGAYTVSCVCEQHMCNSALSLHTTTTTSVFHKLLYLTLTGLLSFITAMVLSK